MCASVAVAWGQPQSDVVDITFDKLGALYHKNESGTALCRVMKAGDRDTCRVAVELVDMEGKPAGYRETYELASPFERYY